MLYAIEIAQTFSAERIVKPEAFFKSMLGSFEQAIKFMIANGILKEFMPRIIAINKETCEQNWFNQEEFNAILERFDD